MPGLHLLFYILSVWLQAAQMAVQAIKKYAKQGTAEGMTALHSAEAGGAPPCRIDLMAANMQGMTSEASKWATAGHAGLCHERSTNSQTTQTEAGAERWTC